VSRSALFDYDAGEHSRFISTLRHFLIQTG
jgi:hypothetical protein